MTNEELYAFVRKNPVSFTGGVLSVLLLAGIYFRSGEVPAAEAELQQKTKEADRFSANVTHSVQLKEHHEALVRAVKEIDARLVRAGQLGVNNQYFFKLESETDTKLVDFRQSGLVPAKTGKPAYSPVAFTVTVQGELRQLLHFLRLLESGAHYARMQSASLVPAGREARRGLLTLSLNLELLGLP